MKRVSLLLVLSALCTLMAYGQSKDIVELGDRREIFVDQFLIDTLIGVDLLMHAPTDEGPVLQFDKPWEGAFSGYCTIIKDGDLFRAYYRGKPNAKRDGGDDEVTCYAESTNGVDWKKPNLGMYTINGSSDNNIVYTDSATATHNFSPFLDTNPNVNPLERYKALGGTKSTGLIGFVSADGLHWIKIKNTPVFTQGYFDSQNVAFWSSSEGKYVCYFRTFSNGFRTVSRTTSNDFINWVDPVQMTFGNTALEHLYTQQTSPYFRAPHIYLAIGARFMPNRQVVSDEQAAVLNVNPKYYKDCSDAFIMSTRGGAGYDRTFMESFIRPGIGLKNWVSRSNYPALNVVQTGPTEMSVYVNEDYAQPSAHLNRYSMRLDGFSSIVAPFRGGELLTNVFTLTGGSLEINYATSAAGEIVIEIQDADGKTIPGFGLVDSQVIIGNEIKRTVQWNGSEDLSSIAMKPVRLRIQMKDANLYSLKFN